MTNHTPAPWVIDNDGDITHFIQSAQGKHFCVAANLGCNGITFNKKADRDLILAAPDMYEALDRVLDFTVSDELRKEVCDALKKARGEV